MRLINQSKNTILAEDVIVASTIFSRIKGLLGKKALGSNQALILDPCNSVHTFFMRFPIDVLFVDKDYKVVKITANLKPNSISGISWRSSKVIELSAGKIAATNTQLQDQIQFQG